MSVFLFLADGFEEIEAVTVVDVLRRAGVDCLMVSTGKDLIVRGAHSMHVKADMQFDHEKLEDAEMLILPGGMPGTANLGIHEGLLRLLKDAAISGKLIAAICAAPSILGKLGILSGKTAVCYPGMEKELAGAIIRQDSVVRDGNIITSRGPGTALEFSLKLAEILKGTEVSDQLKKGLLIKGSGDK